MEEYHRQDFTPLVSEASTPAPHKTAVDDGDEPDEFDCHRKQLVSGVIGDGGWRSELAHYLSDIPKDITKDTDIVGWWGVRVHCHFIFANFANILQHHTKVYPTLSRIALDVLPAQASSIPCERLFSVGKEIANERRSRLGLKQFEQLQMLKFEWRGSVVDYSVWNSGKVEDVNLDEFTELLEAT
jgi:hypothetical protein